MVLKSWLKNTSKRLYFFLAAGAEACGLWLLMRKLKLNFYSILLYHTLFPVYQIHHQGNNSFFFLGPAFGY